MGITIEPKMMGEKSDIEGQASKASDVDAALVFLNHEATTTMTEIDEKKLIRKIDWWIVPLMCE